MPGRNLERERYWREVIGRQAASGLSAAVFCKLESIAPASFFAWKRRLRERDGELQSESSGVGSAFESLASPPTFKASDVAPFGGATERATKKLPGSEQFLPVHIESSPVGERRIRIEWAGDVRVEVPIGDVARDVAAVLQVVDQLMAARAGARRAC